MYLRITRLYPTAGNHRRMKALIDGYLGWLRQQSGFVLGLRMTPRESPSAIVRITIWTNQDEADATALSDHSLAVRSELMIMTIDQTIHEEQFEVDTVEPRVALRPVLQAQAVQGRVQLPSHLAEQTYPAPAG